MSRDYATMSPASFTSVKTAQDFRSDMDAILNGTYGNPSPKTAAAAPATEKKAAESAPLVPPQDPAKTAAAKDAAALRDEDALAKLASVPEGMELIKAADEYGRRIARLEYATLLGDVDLHKQASSSLAELVAGDTFKRLQAIAAPKA